MIKNIVKNKREVNKMKTEIQPNYTAAKIICACRKCNRNKFNKSRNES